MRIKLRTLSLIFSAIAIILNISQRSDSSQPPQPVSAIGMSPGEQGYLGVSLLPAEGTSEDGMEVVGVDPGSMAERIGIYVGDHIIAVDGNYSNSYQDTVEELREAYSTGTGEAQLLIRRNYAKDGMKVISISTPMLRAYTYPQPEPESTQEQSPPTPPDFQATSSQATGLQPASSQPAPQRIVSIESDSEKLSWLVAAIVFGMMMIGWKM